MILFSKQTLKQNVTREPLKRNVLNHHLSDSQRNLKHIKHTKKRLLKVMLMRFTSVPKSLKIHAIQWNLLKISMATIQKVISGLCKYYLEKLLPAPEKTILNDLEKHRVCFHRTTSMKHIRKYQDGQYLTLTL